MLEFGAGNTRIDVRSVWFLLLYASGLLEKITGDAREKIHRGERDNDLPDALALLLATEAESRMRAMLSQRYRERASVLTRVRGRVDHLGTERRQLMGSGRILCRFSELTRDLPRYRHMLTTLRHAGWSAQAPDLRHRCTQAAQDMERLGIAPRDATVIELSREQYGHADRADRDLLLLSRVVRSMCAPEHSPGEVALPVIVRDEAAMRRLFEDAVRGFYRLQLEPEGWFVNAEQRPWPAMGEESDTTYLPRLHADVVLRSPTQQIVVECKFAPVFTSVRTKVVLNPAYVRQLHAYCSVFSRAADKPTRGLLLSAVTLDDNGRDLDLHLDGFPFRVRRVDLSQPPSSMRRALTEALDDWAR